MLVKLTLYDNSPQRNMKLPTWIILNNSSETSVHTRSTRHHIPENGILHSHRRENLKSYMNNIFNHKAAGNKSVFIFCENGLNNGNMSNSALCEMKCCNICVYINQFNLIFIFHCQLRDNTFYSYIIAAIRTTRQSKRRLWSKETNLLYSLIGTLKSLVTEFTWNCKFEYIWGDSRYPKHWDDKWSVVRDNLSLFI
jgi:hypothetical protein